MVAKTHPKRWIKKFFVKSKTLDILPKTLDKTKKNLSHRKRWIFLTFFCQLENAGYLKINFCHIENAGYFPKQFFLLFLL